MERDCHAPTKFGKKLTPMDPLQSYQFYAQTHVNRLKAATFNFQSD